MTYYDILEHIIANNWMILDDGFLWMNYLLFERRKRRHYGTRWVSWGIIPSHGLEKLSGAMALSKL